jgi:hypothetical protein
VDGTNLLHALAHGAEPLPHVALIGRLRALVPAGVAVTVVLDGSPAPGGAGRRIAAGVEVRHAGRHSADALLADLAAASPEGVLVVTDDRALAATLRSLGARTVRASWLADRLARQRLAAPAAGRAKPPAAASAGDDVEESSARWRPGRGATRKTGNPKRGRRPA